MVYYRQQSKFINCISLRWHLYCVEYEINNQSSAKQTTQTLHYLVILTIQSVFTNGNLTEKSPRFVGGVSIPEQIEQVQGRGLVLLSPWKTAWVRSWLRGASASVLSCYLKPPGQKFLGVFDVWDCEIMWTAIYSVGRKSQFKKEEKPSLHMD